MSYSQQRALTAESVGIPADHFPQCVCRLILQRRRGFHVCGFVHDEMLALSPDRIGYDQAIEQIQRMLIKGMQELTPGIPINCEYLLANR